MADLSSHTPSSTTLSRSHPAPLYTAAAQLEFEASSPMRVQACTQASRLAAEAGGPGTITLAGLAVVLAAAVVVVSCRPGKHW